MAIKERWPVALPLGVLEYHGEHSVMGVDTLLVVKTMALLEKEIDMDKYKDDKWYSRSAKDANLKYGNAAKDKILKSIKKILSGDR